MKRPWLYFRTFPHSTSKKRIAARADADEQEAMEYTNSFVANRHSEDEYPDIYSDTYPDCVYKQWETKPRKNDHKGMESIRRKNDESDNVCNDAE